MHCALIFDCDGVLVDSEAASCRASLLTLQKLGAPLTPDDMPAFIGRSEKQMIIEVNRRFGMSIREDLGDEIEEIYMSLAEGLLPMPGVQSALEQFRAAGIPMAVASSGSHRKIRFSLDKTGLLPYFEAVCSAHDVQQGKPAPDLFLLAADRLNASPPNCIVLEDSLYGIIGARAAGMAAFGFTSSYPAQRLNEAGADATFDHFEDLPALIENWVAKMSPEER